MAKNWIEYQCPCGKNYKLLVGTVPTCPWCGHVFTHTEIQIPEDKEPVVYGTETGRVTNPSLPSLKPQRVENPPEVENLSWQERSQAPVLDTNIERECAEIVERMLG